MRGWLFKRALVRRINYERTPVVRRGPLRASRVAQEWANHLAATGQFYHRDQGVVLRRCDVAFAGEVIGRGLLTPRSLVQLWLHSPTHRAVLKNSSYRRVGIGVATDSEGRLVVVANFVGR